jgi:hypothetical protein
MGLEQHVTDYNVVLISGLPLRRIRKGRAEVDPTLLPFVVEELMAYSAVKVALANNASGLLPHLPDEEAPCI